MYTLLYTAFDTDWVTQAPRFTFQLLLGKKGEALVEAKKLHESKPVAPEMVCT